MTDTTRTTRLSDHYRFIGCLTVHDWGTADRPNSTEVNAFIKIEDGRMAITSSQPSGDDRHWWGELPKYPWIKLDPTDLSAGEYVDALVAALLEVRRMHDDANLKAKSRG